MGVRAGRLCEHVGTVPRGLRVHAMHGGGGAAGTDLAPQTPWRQAGLSLGVWCGRTGLGGFWKCRPHRPWEMGGTAWIRDNPESCCPPCTELGVSRRRHRSAGTSRGQNPAEACSRWPACVHPTSGPPWQVSACPSGLWLRQSIVWLDPLSICPWTVGLAPLRLHFSCTCCVQPPTPTAPLPPPRGPQWTGAVLVPAFTPPTLPPRVSQERPLQLLPGPLFSCAFVVLTFSPYLQTSGCPGLCPCACPWSVGTHTWGGPCRPGPPGR